MVAAFRALAVISAIMVGLLAVRFGHGAVAESTLARAAGARPELGQQSPDGSSADENGNVVGSYGDDLSVSVPLAPSQPSLPGLCRAFLNSDDQGKQGTSFQILVGATGGTTAATTAWCRTYLALKQDFKRGDN